MLYNLVACSHRVTKDLFGNPAEQDEVSPFVRMLWEKGAAHEEAIIAGLGTPFLDLSRFPPGEKERLTEEAIARGEPLIYSGRISADNLVGEPDILRRSGNGYVAGDIKSGVGLEGASEDLGTPKLHYAVQVALYTDILERRGWSAGRTPFILDVRGQEVPYDLDELRGKRNPSSLWSEYRAVLAEAEAIVNGRLVTLPAYSSSRCKLCSWYSSCLDELHRRNDLTLLPQVGRSTRDAMMGQIDNIVALAAADVAAFVRGNKTAFPGVGRSTLERMQERARLATRENPRPYLRRPVSLPRTDLELFFDIEVDPLRDLCYLHGFVERHRGDNASERYVSFFTDEPTPAAEEAAFAEAWSYVQEHRAATIYYYSKYERTIWRKLQQKYPRVCSAEDIEAMFDPTRAVDLYFDVVLDATEWPTRDYSIKTLAKFLGFHWRDADPSGAASIEWFDNWLRTGDRAIKSRILAYNEDDCRATRVVLDGIRSLSTNDIC